jgi:hypothetical protein
MGLKFTLEETNYAGLIEEGSVYRAKLVDISEKTWTPREPGKEPNTRVEFRFKLITDDDDPHDGEDIWGNTSDKFVDHPNCKLKSWSEAILGMKIPPGYNLETDHLLSRECQVIIGVRQWVQNGEQREKNVVRDVMPTRENMARLIAEDNEPF